MMVRYINKSGHVWDFKSIADANLNLEKGWRKKANRISHPDGDWLEISDCEFGIDSDVPFASPDKR